MLNIKDRLQDFMMLQDEEFAAERKVRDSFWCSESEKSLFDMYCSWKNITPTNPIDAEKLVMFNAAKLMEISLIETLQKMGLVKKQENDKQLHIAIERYGIKVSGYLDGVLEDGTPIEVKTMADDFQAKALEDGKPKTGYLKQLAMYIDATNQERGTLVYIDRRNGKLYEFCLLREPGTLKFRCGGIEFDLGETYKRWAKLYNENVLTNIEPDVFECGAYKADIETLDWNKISKADISKARNGHKVIGSNRAENWKILYSPWKDLIVQKQGASLGYSEQELARIKELTKNYSNLNRKIWKHI